MAAKKLIQIENTGRQKWMFPVFRSITTASGRVVRVLDHDASVVIGDSRDAKVIDATRGPRCPSPVVQLTEEKIAELGPGFARTVAALVKRGEFRRTELAA